MTNKNFELKYSSVEWTQPTKITFLEEYQVYSAPTPGSGAVISMILNLMEDSAQLDADQFWHRAVESFKHGYGHRTRLGDFRLDLNSTVLPVFNNMLSKDHAKSIEDLIKSNETSQNYTYYGADFAASEDHGTTNLCVLHPDGCAMCITSTINTK